MSTLRSQKIGFLLSAFILANLTGCQKTVQDKEEQLKQNNMQQVVATDNSNKEKKEQVIINGLVVAQGDNIERIKEIRSKLILINCDEVVYHQRDAVEGVRGIKVRKNGVDKYGFTNEEGKMIIEPLYDGAKFYESVYGFEHSGMVEGLAPVKKGNKWGYIDIRGREIIPFIYDDVEIFSEGLAPAKFNGKWGFINKEGEVVIDFKFDSASVFKQGYGIVTKDNNKEAFINHKGELFGEYEWIERDRYNLHFEQGIAYIHQPSGRGLIGIRNGRLTTFIEPKYFKLYPQSEDGKVFEFIDIYHDEKGNYVEDKSYAGLVNIYGEELERYPYSKKLKEDASIEEEIRLKEKEEANHIGSTGLKIFQEGDLYGVKDATGKVVLSADYYGIETIKDSNSLIILEIKPLVKVLYNLESKQVLSKEYFNISLERGLLVATTSLGKQTVLSTNGDEDCPAYKEFNLEEHQLGYKLIEEDRGGYRVANLDNVFLSDWNYDKIYHPDGKYRIVMKDLYYGIADLNGNLLIPCVFDEIKIKDQDTVDFSYVSLHNEELIQGYFSIDANIPVMESYITKLGDINTSQMAIKSDYEQLRESVLYDSYRDFGYGTSFVIESYCENGIRGFRKTTKEPQGSSSLYGFMNEEYDLIIEPIYEEAKFYMSMSDASNGFEEGLAPVKKDGKWGYINVKGETVIDFIYEDAEVFSQGLAAVKLDSKWGYIDQNANRVLKPRYKQGSPFYHGYASVQLENDQWTFINRAGEKFGLYDSIYYGRWRHFRDTKVAYTEQEEKWGLVQIKEKVLETIIEPKYDKLHDDDRGQDLYTFYDSKFDKEGYHIGTEIGYLSIITGTEVVRFKEGLSDEDLNNSISDKKDINIQVDEFGRQIYRRGILYGLKDSSGKILIPAEYYNIKQLGFKENFYAIETTSNKVAVFDISKGQVITNFYESIYANEEDQKIYASIGGESRVLDINGNELLSYNIDTSVDFDRGIKILKDETGQEFIADMNSKPLNTYRYDRVVAIDHKEGLSDVKGNLIVPCAYDSLEIIDEDTIFITYTIHSNRHKDLSKKVFGKLKLSQNRNTLERWLNNFKNSLGTE